MALAIMQDTGDNDERTEDMELETDQILATSAHHQISYWLTNSAVAAATAAH